MSLAADSVRDLAPVVAPALGLVWVVAQVSGWLPYTFNANGARAFQELTQNAAMKIIETEKRKRTRGRRFTAAPV